MSEPYSIVIDHSYRLFTVLYYDQVCYTIEWYSGNVYMRFTVLHCSILERQCPRSDYYSPPSTYVCYPEYSSGRSREHPVRDNVRCRTEKTHWTVQRRTDSRPCRRSDTQGSSSSYCQGHVDPPWNETDVVRTDTIKEHKASPSLISCIHPWTIAHMYTYTMNDIKIECEGVGDSYIVIRVWEISLIEW